MTPVTTVWLDDFVPGTSYVTTARTITEADLVLFTSLIGLQEELFTNASKDRPMLGKTNERLVPGILAFTYAEGLVAQLGLLRGSGRAFITADVTFARPTFVGDTVSCRVVVESVQRRRQQSRHGKIVFDIHVDTDREADVISYRAARLVAAGPPSLQPTSE